MILSTFGKRIKNQRTGELFRLLLYITVLILFYCVFFRVVLHRPFLLWNDQWFQYNEFYKEWIRLIKECLHGNGYPFYSWNMFLGTDFFSSMGYYCTGDVFLPMLLLFFRNNIETGLLIETFLCAYLSGVLMNCFLKEFGIENASNRIFVSVLYTIGGQAILYVGNYMFHRFYAFMPLLFFGALYYFRTKKHWPFTLAVAILFLQNYYFMFPSIIFLFFFCLWQEWKRNVSLPVFTGDFIQLVLCLFIGFSISAIIVLPSALSVLGNPRLESTGQSGLLWDKNVYYGLYLSLTTMNPWNTPGNIFYTYHDAHDNWFNLYIGLIATITAFYHLVKKNEGKDLAFFLFITLILALKPLSSMMHGFTIPSLRWVFLYQFMMLFFAAKGLEENNNKAQLIILAIYLAGFAFIRIQGGAQKWIDAIANHNHLVLIYASLISGILIFLVFCRYRKIAFLLTIIQMTISTSYYYCRMTDGIQLHYDEAINPEYVDYFHEQDSDKMFRYYLDYNLNYPVNYLNRNKSLSYHMMSTSSYSSTYDTNIVGFLKLADCGNVLDWNMEVDDPYINTALGVKYYIVYKEEDLPEELSFHYVYNLNHLEVYENEQFKGFGYTNGKIDHLADNTDPKTFISTTYVDDDAFDITKYNNLSAQKMTVLSYSTNALRSEIYVESDNILVIPIPNNKGWIVEVNGEKVNPISVDGGFLGVPVAAGNNSINMHFKPPHFKAAFFLSAAGVMTFVLLFIIDIKKNKAIKL